MENKLLEKFTLNKVKVKGQGLEAHWETEETKGAEVYHDKNNRKSDRVPHEDLSNILRVFRGYMAQVHYYSVINELVDSKVFLATPAQIKILKNKYKDLESKISITGISISGKDDNKGIIITATLKTGTGHVTAINSQRLKYNGTHYGFEEDLENLITDLESEVFEYIINGKAAQLEMAFEDADEMDGKTAAAGKDARQMDLMEEALGADEEE